MSYLKRKYIDSHWLIFTIQGAFALVFGWFILFNPNLALTDLMPVVGTFLLTMGILELFNVLHREVQQNTWALSLAIAVIETVVALALLLTVDQIAVWHLVVLALYVVCRGIFELLIGLRSIDDLTDRFIWILAGVCGVIMGIVIFNAGSFETTEFVRFFGAYVLIFGLASLIYGIHNHEQKLAAASDRAAARKSAQKRLSKPAKTSAKAPKSTKSSKSRKK